MRPAAEALRLRLLLLVEAETPLAAVTAAAAEAPVGFSTASLPQGLDLGLHHHLTCLQRMMQLVEVRDSPLGVLHLDHHMRDRRCLEVHAEHFQCC